MGSYCYSIKDKEQNFNRIIKAHLHKESNSITKENY